MNAVSYIKPDIAPQSVEAEQQLLGAMLLNGGGIDLAKGKGGVKLFNDPVHARIFSHIAEKDKHGHLISPITVADVMRGTDGLDDLGGAAYLARLAGSASAGSAIPAYVDMLADLSSKRMIVGAMSEANAAIARGEEPSHIIAGRLEAALIEAGASSGIAGPVSMAKAVGLAVDQAMAAYSGDSDVAVKSGLPSLDALISGFYPGELILLGGRPSMGKTAVSLSIGLNAARAGHGVVIASLEMNPEAMALRALSEGTAQRGRGVSYSAMRKGDMTDVESRYMIEAGLDIGALPIVFLPRTYSDLGALFSGAKQAHRMMQGGMKLLIVDYAQLLRSNAKSRYEQITEISIALKSLAGQLNIPVLALSQLSRAIETRDDKRPMMSDLRESGQLEQDADTVLFCYRDEYYLERERPDERDTEAFSAWEMALNNVRGELEVIVAKQRQGEIGTARMRFNPATNMLSEGRK